MKSAIRKELSEIKKTLKKYEKRVKRIADEMEVEAAQLRLGTTRQINKAGELDIKAYYLHEAASDIGSSTIHL